MVDLQVFKGEKKKGQIISLLDGLVEMRLMYNSLLEVAHAKKGYTEQQINEAKQLTSGGFHTFIGKISKMQ